jgi:anthranilate phosphoribosyltransferase
MIKSIEMLLQGNEPKEEQYSAISSEIFSQQLNNSQIAAVLSLLATKKVENQILPFAREMRKHMIRFESSVKLDTLLDTCGTGGDSKGTFNISTASAILASSLGLNIAKHGNRAATGKSGSADVIEELGIKIQQQTGARRTLEQSGFCFLFAQTYHPKLKEIAKVRKELGFRTVFNLLGPIANPSGAKRQLIGVYDEKYAIPLAETLGELGCARAMVVNSQGMDEIGLGITKVVEIRNGKIEKYEIEAKEYGFRHNNDQIPKVSNAKESARIILRIFSGQEIGAAREVVVMNTAAACFIGGISPSIESAISAVNQSIGSGKAMEKLEEIRQISNQD